MVPEGMGSFPGAPPHSNRGIIGSYPVQDLKWLGSQGVISIGSLRFHCVAISLYFLFLSVVLLLVTGGEQD